MALRWIGATLLVMLVGFLTVRSVEADVVVAVLAAVLLLVVGRASGLTWAEIGFSATWRRGLRWALASLGLVIAVYALLLVTPLEVLLDDARYDNGWPQALVTALLVVPLGTVLWEELAFRGVMWAQLRRRWSTPLATVISSLLFGVWHALPALRFADANEAAGTVVDAQSVTVDAQAVTIGTVVITVLATAVGGVVLCEVRRRSDSLVAPIGLHWAINGVGVIAVAVASGA